MKLNLVTVLGDDEVGVVADVQDARASRRHRSGSRACSATALEALIRTASSKTRVTACSRPSPIDPRFGIGYQSLAVVSRNLGQTDEDAGWDIKDRQSEHRRDDGTRALPTRAACTPRLTGDYQQCVKEYGELICSL